MDRPREFDLSPGEGLRIDFTDYWMLREILEDGTAAVFEAPWGDQATLRQDQWQRIGPGMQVSIQPAPAEGRITFLLNQYIPLVHRHPPRDHKKCRPGNGA